MKNESGYISNRLWNHLEPSFQMIRKIVEDCPDNVWNAYEDGDPIWLHIYHALFSVDFWFGDSKKPVFPDFGKPVTPDMGKKQEEYLTKAETRDYLGKIRKKAESFIGTSELEAPSLIYDKWTTMDGVLEQIRHTQYHIGRCNGILARHREKTAGWAYYRPE